MIESKITTQTEIKCPKLMISKETGVIILANSENSTHISGTVIANPNNVSSVIIGNYSDTFNSFNFLDFQGEITLSNK